MPHLFYCSDYLVACIAIAIRCQPAHNRECLSEGDRNPLPLEIIVAPATEYGNAWNSMAEISTLEVQVGLSIPRALPLLFLAVWRELPGLLTPTTTLVNAESIRA